MEKEKKKGFITEFKEFVTRGNVIDLAVGVIIGGAFSTITNSLVNDVFMPIASMFIGGIKFDSWKIELPNLFGVVSETPNTINIGVFIATIINFLILALVIFLMIKAINRVRSKADSLKRSKEVAEAVVEEVKEEVAPSPTSEELLTEILAELRKK